MTTESTVTATAGGITMTIDLHEMLTALDPNGRYVGYDPDQDEAHYEPASLEVLIADLAAQYLVKHLRNEVASMVKDRVSETINAEVVSIVRAHINGEDVQRTDEFGNAIGAPIPLTQMIVKAATEGLNKSEGYGRGPTRLQKMVNDAVGAAFKKELTEVVDQARTAAKEAVKQNAAVVIKETIERATRGL